MKARKNKKLIRAVLAILAMAPPATLAEDVFVQQPSVTLRAGKGAAYEEVATVKKGDKLTVLAREGKWLKVSAAGKQGWVFENSVAAKSAGGGLSGLSSLMSQGAGTSTVDEGAAGRGIGESLTWAKGANMDPRPLDRMIAARKRISPQQWERFVNEGRVGPAKQ
jgi:uncharacterized protein YraI